MSSAANGSSSHALEFVSSPNRQLISFSTISLGKEVSQSKKVEVSVIAGLYNIFVCFQGTKTEDTELLNPLVSIKAFSPGKKNSYSTHMPPTAY